MAKKKRKSTTATRRRTTTPTRRRSYHKKADSSYIPAAAATAGLICANMQPIRTVVSNMSVAGLKQAAHEAVQPDQLKKTAVYTVGAAVGGEVFKKFAPNVIKKPVGKIAKKIPRVF